MFEGIVIADEEQKSVYGNSESSLATRGCESRLKYSLISVVAGLSACVSVLYLLRLWSNRNPCLDNHSSGLIEIDSESANFINVDCAYLRTQLGAFEFDRIVTSRKDNKCTVENAGDILNKLLEVIIYKTNLDEGKFRLKETRIKLKNC